MENDIKEGTRPSDIASCISLLYESVCTLADEVATFGAVLEELERVSSVRQ